MGYWNEDGGSAPLRMRTEGHEGNEGMAALRFLGLLLFQKGAHGGQKWEGGGPQEPEPGTAPEEAFSGGPARRHSDKMADPRHGLAFQSIRGDLFRFVGTEEFITIEMHQMVRRIGNPDFCFPRNLRREFSESVARQEGRNENDVCRAFQGQPF